MTLSLEEISVIDKLVEKLKSHQAANLRREEYFNGENRLKDLKISIPPNLTNVKSVVGWPSTAVSVLEERLDLEGFLVNGEDLGLDNIFRSNDMDSECSLAHLDALIYGIGFVVVGKGQEGEADPLITVESPKRMTAIHDLRKRRVDAAISVNFDNRGDIQSGSLYLPEATIKFEKSGYGGWVEVDRDSHMMGRVPVARLVNQPRSGDTAGRSEISEAVMSYTDSAMRTLLGAEVAREFYSAPQRYVLGADEKIFMDNDGNPLNPWSVIQGRVLALPPNEDGSMPSVGQFSANSTQPYFEQVRALAQMLAAETAIPPSYLGFQTDNPASADAIRQMEARLVKRAERRQRQFGRTWTEVARLALLVRDGDIPQAADTIRPIWRDASTPTRAAAADEAVKLIASGVLLPDSEITYARIGLSDSDKETLTQEKRRASAQALIGNLATAAQAAQSNPAVVESINVNPS